MHDKEIEELKRSFQSLAEQRVLDQSEMKKSIDELATIIKPMAETYSTALVLGKWLTGFLVFISILIGVILGFRNLFKK